MKHIEVKVSRFVQIEGRTDDPDGEVAAREMFEKTLEAYTECMKKAWDEGLVPADNECRIDVAMVCKPLRKGTQDA